MNKQVFLQSGWFWVSGWAAVLLFGAVLIPGLLVGHSSPATRSVSSLIESPAAHSPLSGLTVPVYLSREKRTAAVPLEQYVRGVVAAEMPVEFALEALKAQALAARTYVVCRMLERDGGAGSAEDALVTDTAAHQVFASDGQLREQWGDNYPANMAKLNRAVQETQGLILTYEGRPINATFFSTSNGFTENSEDYWTSAVPYLRSVPSPWDKAISPKYKTTVELTAKQFWQKLGFPGAAQAGAASSMRVIDTTAGHRIKRMIVAGRSFSGRDAREKLGLPSSQFEWQVRGGAIRFTAYGYGHGVGMSQWGAHGMAREGRTAEQIVKHYYTGVEIAPLSSLSLSAF